MHVNIEDRRPICKFFKDYQQCQKGDECPFRHVLPNTNENNAPTTGGPANELCPYYERGFCDKGPECKFFHFEQYMMLALYQGNNMDTSNSFILCPNYIAGFCPKGPNCKQKHLKSVIIDEQTSLKELANFPDSENWASCANIMF